MPKSGAVLVAVLGRCRKIFVFGWKSLPCIKKAGLALGYLFFGISGLSQSFRNFQDRNSSLVINSRYNSKILTYFRAKHKKFAIPLLKEL